MGKQLDPAKNIALMASAGTGKTYNLALRVVSVLMSSRFTSRPLFDATGGKIVGEEKLRSQGKLLCITFTRKAAAEMGRRVHEYLAALADGLLMPEDDRYKSVAEALGISDPLEIRAKANEARRRVFADPTLLQISTIDSFVMLMLKLFPLEANLRPDFTMLEEQAMEDLEKNAYTVVFENLPYKTRYIEFFFRYIWHMRLQPYVFTERLKKDCTWILERAVTLEQELANAETISIDNLLDIMDLAEEKTQALYTQLGKLDKYLAGKKESLSASLQRRLDDLKRLSTQTVHIKDIFENKLLYYLSPEKVPAKGKKMSAEYCRLYEELETLVRDYVLINSSLEKFLVLSMASRIQAGMDSIKLENGRLSFADLSRLTHTMMTRDTYPVDKDYLYFRLDGRLEHILVDEFQDTSPVQWAILQPLAEEAMAGVAQNDKSGSFFCVGDPKQTIYGFRGSTPTFFNDIIHTYKDRLEVEKLQINHRSDKVLVDYTNSLFAGADELIGGSGRLSFGFIPQEAASGKEGWLSVRAVRGDSPKERDNKRLSILKEALDTFKGRFRLSETAILVGKKEDGIAVHRFLTKEGISSYLGFSAKMSDRRTYKTIAALVSYMYSGDRLALAEFLLTPPSVIPPDKISDERVFRRFEGLLKAYLARSEGKSVYERIRTLGRRLSLNSRLHNEPDYHELTDIIAGKLSSVTNIIEFRDAFANLAAAKSLSGGEGIAIMTVHGAKGLQFPAVILFDVNRFLNPNNNRQHFFIDEAEPGKIRLQRLLNAKQRYYAPEGYAESYERNRMLGRLESVNQLYVAVTRAANALVIITEDYGSDKIDRFILDHGLMEKGSLPPEHSGTEEKTRKTHLPPAFRQCWQHIALPLTEKDRAESARKTFNSPSVPGRVKDYLKLALMPRRQKLGEYGYEAYSSRMYGNFFHESVYNLYSFTPEAVANALNKAYVRYAGYLEEGAFAQAQNDLALLVEDARFKELVSDGALFREKAIYHEGELLVVDMYCLKQKYIEVLDFKTGEPASSRAEEYKQQVAQYKHALSVQHGKTARGTLIYIHKGKLTFVEV